MGAVPRWRISPIDAGTCRVLDAEGRHVGNLKWIQGQWKFKAIGYDAQGGVIPGGGPLTDRHNTVFADLDEAALQAGLAPVRTALQFLAFELGEAAEGVSTLEAMASTPAAQHAAAVAEAQQVLDWAWQHFPQGPGPADDGFDWDHDLQLSEEDGGWHVVTLTLTGSPAFVDAFLQVFGGPPA